MAVTKLSVRLFLNRRNQNGFENRTTHASTMVDDPIRRPKLLSVSAPFVLSFDGSPKRFCTPNWKSSIAGEPLLTSRMHLP